MTQRKSAYARAGVDIAAAEKAVEMMKKDVRSTHNERVLTGIGLFGGLLDVSFLKDYRHPVLVTSIDGVGTKTMIAEMMDKLDTIGKCLVNHCVNDILCLGASPIAFLDYLASDKLESEVMEQIVAGMAMACQAINLPIMGGETAEIPGVYCQGRHDVVGSIIGIVEKDQIIDGSKIETSDMLIGLPSNGLHTNGYSLARKAFFETAGYEVDTYLDDLGCTVGEELLRIHRCYFPLIAPLLLHPHFKIHGIAHITGGGFYDNIGRLIPDGLQARISYQWNIPTVFQIIQEIEKVSDKEMRQDFNLGIGMVLIVPFTQTKVTRIALRDLGEPNHLIVGTISKTSSKDKVVFTY